MTILGLFFLIIIFSTYYKWTEKEVNLLMHRSTNNKQFQVKYTDIPFWRYYKNVIFTNFCFIKHVYFERLKWSMKLLTDLGGPSIAPWFCLRLQLCGPRFESQAYTLHFFNLYYRNCSWNKKRTKINEIETHFCPY